jgi:quercetin dioxygenase-like cupin family protein
MEKQNSRLRPHPNERFAGASHVFDLRHELQEVRAEAHEASDGHRAKTLLHRGPLTQVLLAFAPGGEMRDHKANGLVTILCLEGAITVEAQGQTHTLEPLNTLVLDPNVPHSVRAEHEAAMLLSVVLHKD